MYVYVCQHACIYAYILKNVDHLSGSKLIIYLHEKIYLKWVVHLLWDIIKSFALGHNGNEWECGCLSLKRIEGNNHSKIQKYNIQKYLALMYTYTWNFLEKIVMLKCQQSTLNPR